MKNGGEIVIYKNDVEKGQDLKPGKVLTKTKRAKKDGNGKTKRRWKRRKSRKSGILTKGSCFFKYHDGKQCV